MLLYADTEHIFSKFRLRLIKVYHVVFLMLLLYQHRRAFLLNNVIEPMHMSVLCKKYAI